MLTALSPRFEAAAALDDWIATIQFSNVGGSAHSAAPAAAFRVSNRDSEDSASAAARSSSLAEDLVEALVRLLQTGMRPGLRGALEVVKVLERVPDAVLVPVPTAAFTTATMAQPTRWFRSHAEMVVAASGSGSGDAAAFESNANVDAAETSVAAMTAAAAVAAWRGYDIVSLPMKAIRSVLFIVNNSGSAGGSASSEVRMFVRLCLQQGVLLAAMELLHGLLRGSDGAIADFLYAHSAASPLLDDLTFPRVFEALRKLGGPPLVVRAVASASNVPVAALLDAPWAPLADDRGSDQPVLAAWCVWMATRGLRLQWDLEYSRASDAAQPMYVPIAAPGSGTARGGGTARTTGGSSSGTTSARGVAEDASPGDAAGAAAAAATTTTTTTGAKTTTTTTTTIVGPGGERRIVKRVMKRRAATATIAAAAASPSLSSGTGEAVSAAKAEPGGESSDDASAAVTASTPPPRAPSATAGASSPPAVAAARLSTPERGGAMSATLAVVAAAASPSVNAAAFAAREAADRNAAQQAAETRCVADTLARWRADATASNAALADAAQPLLDAYAALVRAKWATAVGAAEVAERRMLDCHDVFSAS
jgi:hypothetical protein